MNIYFKLLKYIFFSIEKHSTTDKYIMVAIGTNGLILGQ